MPKYQLNIDSYDDLLIDNELQIKINDLPKFQKRKKKRKFDDGTNIKNNKKKYKK